jgi:hypothetical protein
MQEIRPLKGLYRIPRLPFGAVDFKTVCSMDSVAKQGLSGSLSALLDNF